MALGDENESFEIDGTQISITKNADEPPRYGVRVHLTGKSSAARGSLLYTYLSKQLDKEGIRFGASSGGDRLRYEPQAKDRHTTPPLDKAYKVITEAVAKLSVTHPLMGGSFEEHMETMSTVDQSQEVTLPAKPGRAVAKFSLTERQLNAVIGKTLLDAGVAPDKIQKSLQAALTYAKELAGGRPR